jgi:DNA-binding transcriptional regulator LsrR (DeoR family)
MGNAKYGKPPNINALLRHREEIVSMYRGGKTQEEIGRHFGCSRSQISKYAEELGVAGGITNSRYRGILSKLWKGGKSVKNGYPVEREGGGKQRASHRIVAEKALGRRLKSDEVVHHINGDRADNRNRNLLICSNSYHQWIENEMSRRYKLEHFASL